MSFVVNIKCPKCGNTLKHMPESKHFFCVQCQDELAMKLINGKITLLSIYKENKNSESVHDE